MCAINDKMKLGWKYRQKNRFVVIRRDVYYFFVEKVIIE